MTDSSTHHSAAPSALGYYYQALYALDLLLRDQSDEALVYLETLDDIEQQSTNAVSLHQLKYSGTAKPVTIKDADFWKTLRIWIPIFLDANDFTPRFFYVTTRPLHKNSPLRTLMDQSTERCQLYEALVQEAQRFTSRQGADNSTPKFRGCEMFLDLGKALGSLFLDRIQICPTAFAPADALARVESYLVHIPASDRCKVAERLVEWWDTQAFRSLNNPPHPIHKIEVQKRITNLIQDLSETRLFDDFSARLPDDVWEEVTDVMVSQIRLVDGFNSHIERAAREMWRARSQRGRWMADEVGFSAELSEYDRELVQEWSDRHSVVRDEAETQDAAAQRHAGRRLLEWSHTQAPQEVRPIRPDWTPYFLVRGTYQLLADEKYVGWHPRYDQLLSTSTSVGADSSASNASSSSGTTEPADEEE